MLKSINSIKPNKQKLKSQLTKVNSYLSPLIKIIERIKILESINKKLPDQLEERKRKKPK